MNHNPSRITNWHVRVFSEPNTHYNPHQFATSNADRWSDDYHNRLIYPSPHVAEGQHINIASETGLFLTPQLEGESIGLIICSRTAKQTHAHAQHSLQTKLLPTRLKRSIRNWTFPHTAVGRGIHKSHHLPVQTQQ